MKKHATLTDISLDTFDPSIRNEVAADIATAQTLLNMVADVSNAISRVKYAVVALFSGGNKASESKAA